MLEISIDGCWIWPLVVLDNKTEKPFSLQADEKEVTIMTKLVIYFCNSQSKQQPKQKPKQKPEQQPKQQPKFTDIFLLRLF